MKTKRVVLFVTLGISVSIFIVVCINTFGVLRKYNKINKEYEGLNSKLMEPITNDKGTFSANELKKIFSEVPNSKISLITEIASKDGSVNVIRRLNLEDFNTLTNTVLEISIECEDIEKVLEYFKTKKLGYEYINLKGSQLSMRVLVKGEE